MALVLDTGPLLAALDGADRDHRRCVALIESEHPAVADLARCHELQKRYGDLRLGVVDASVIALLERLDERVVATLDRRHFSVVLPAHVEALTIVP